MKTKTKVIKIGNSQGLRIPKPIVERMSLEGEVILEEKNGGLFIYSKNTQKLSWEETYKKMAKSDEDWSDWN